MGTSPGLGVSEADSKMRAFAFVLLAAVAINADADADAYTVGQVTHGLTNGGVITGVDYSNGVVSGYGAIGNRPVTHVAGVHPVNTVAGVYSAHPVNTVAGIHNTHHAVATPAVHTVATPAVHSVYSGLRHHLYGKREAEAEPEAEADPLLHTNSLVHHAGVGHVAGVHPVSTVAGVYSTHAVPAVHAGVSHVPAVYASRPVHTVTTHAVPAVHSVGVPAVHSVYSGYNTHLYGKREAEAYTIAQVHAGLPVVNAYATGHPHNVGYTTNMVSPFHHVYSGYGHFGFHG